MMYAFDREAGVNDSELLGSAALMQIGASRSANFTLLMLKSGIRDVTVCDPQIVEVENLRQTVFTREHLYSPKVSALASIGLEAEPRARIKGFQCLAEEMLDLEERMAKAALVKIGIDDPAAQFRLADLAQKAGTDALVTGMTGDGQQWFVVGIFPDGPSLRELLPKAWDEIQQGFRPKAYYPGSALNTETMNVAAARIAVGLLHYRAGSTLSPISDVGAAFVNAPIAIGFNGFHAPSGFFMPATFSHPE